MSPKPYDEIAPLYDSEFSFTEDLYFYHSYLPQAPAWLLEIGCGTGRLSLPLAQEGYQVVGIDASWPMLKNARQKLKNKSRFYPVCMDMKDIAFKKSFDAILMPFGVLHFLDERERKKFLTSLRYHLVPAGCLLIDLFNPYNIKSHSQMLKKSFSHSPEGTLIVKYTEQKIEGNKIIAKQRYYEYEYGKNLPLKTYGNCLELTIIYPDVIEYELWDAGFWIKEMLGDYNGSCFSHRSPRLLIIAYCLD